MKQPALRQLLLRGLVGSGWHRMNGSFADEGRRDQCEAVRACVARAGAAPPAS